MWSFFIALFGGIYWYLRIGIAKDEKKRFETDLKRRHDKMIEQIRDWEAKTTDYSKEKEMSIIARNGWKEEPYYTEIWTAADELGWDKIKERMEYLATRESTLDGFYYFRFIVLLANRGLLPTSVSSLGIRYGTGAISDNSLFMLAPLNYEDTQRNNYNLMVWLTKKLREHGLPVNPVAEDIMRPRDYSYLNRENYKRSHLIWDAMVLEGYTIKGCPHENDYII